MWWKVSEVRIAGLLRKLKEYMGLERSKTLAVYWLYAAAVALAELLTAFWSIKLGFFVHLSLTGLLLAHSARSSRHGKPWLYLALSLAPLIRVVSLSIPLAGISPILWYVAISVPLFASGVIVARILGFRSHDVGLTCVNLPMQFLIALAGLPLGFIEYSVSLPAPVIIQSATGNIWLSAIVLVVCTGFLEEFIFRGIMYSAAVKAAGERFALFFASSVFTIMHITQLSFSGLLFVFMVSLLFTRVYAWQGSILGLSLAHGIINIAFYIVCPLDPYLSSW
ncbi:MAG TPA: CPBP family intramembrane metalloprotease [Desulfotomaculum sp.]|nr:CPBP family intramembrane metalloprotease [Desulfotomaculum sp.]